MEQVEEFNRLIFQFQLKLSLALQILESKLGISQIEFNFLNQIALTPGLSPSDLIYQFALNKATVSLHLEKMKSAGFIEEKIDSRDRRQKNLYITESGTQLVQKVIDLRHTITRKVIVLLGPVIYKTFKTLMENILDRFDEKQQKLTTFFNTQERKGRQFLIDIPYDELLSELSAIFPLLFDT